MVKLIIALIAGFYLGAICAVIFIYGKWRQKESDLKSGIYFEQEEETIKALQYSWRYLPQDIKTQLKEKILNGLEFKELRKHSLFDGLKKLIEFS